ERTVQALGFGLGSRRGLLDVDGLVGHQREPSSIGCAPTRRVPLCPSNCSTYTPAPAPPFSERRASSSPVSILWCSVRIACISVSGPGGQPGAYTSTGTIWSTPCTSA